MKGFNVDVSRVQEIGLSLSGDKPYPIGEADASVVDYAAAVGWTLADVSQLREKRERTTRIINKTALQRSTLINSRLVNTKSKGLSR